MTGTPVYNDMLRTGAILCFDQHYQDESHMSHDVHLYAYIDFHKLLQMNLCEAIADTGPLYTMTCLGLVLFSAMIGITTMRA